MFKSFERLRHFAFATLILCGAAALYGCTSESDIEDNEEQRDDIISYLEAKHTPLLIAESAVVDSFYSEPEFYFQYGDYAFLYIEDYYNTERETKNEIKSGSRVLINFRLYEFTGSDISDSTLPVYTNEPLYESLYIDAGMNTEFWTFSPMEFIIGTTTTLPAIQQGLKLCREGDVVEIYMTRNMAYDDDVIGNIDQWSSLVFLCTILSVEN